MPATIKPTDREVVFDKDEIIVSKTDLKGRITYANQTFCKIASYSEAEVLGQPHSMIRHPDMPRAVFKLLWDTIEQGREIFAYVKNITKHGDFYWVYAHVTPSRDRSGRIVGYHSNRRVPDRHVLTTHIVPLYHDLLAIERSHKSRKDGLAASFQTLVDNLDKQGVSYDEFILTLGWERPARGAAAMGSDAGPKRFKQAKEAA